uniref:Uncharacterized protein n=1 Tax=Glossina pallidipes TaxID=7398 RepID=A0A1A9ZTL3_GLOPL
MLHRTPSIWIMPGEYFSIKQVRNFREESVTLLTTPTTKYRVGALRPYHSLRLQCIYYIVAVTNSSRSSFYIRRRDVYADAVNDRPTKATPHHTIPPSQYTSSCDFIAFVATWSLSQCVITIMHYQFVIAVPNKVSPGLLHAEG